MLLGIKHLDPGVGTCETGHSFSVALTAAVKNCSQTHAFKKKKKGTFTWCMMSEQKFSTCKFFSFG